MSPALRRVIRVLLVGGAVVGALAAARAALGHLAGEPGASSGRGSFDTWPTVTPAPGRRVEEAGAPGPGAGDGPDPRPR